MLKESIICIIIVVAIFFGNYKLQSYTKETVSEISTELNDLKEELKNEDSEEKDKTAKEKAESVHKKWEERYVKLAYFIEHDELEKIETNLIEVKSYIDTQEYGDAIDELDKGEYLLKHIKDKYAFNLENIF